MTSEDLHHLNPPDHPGVYIMRDEHGKIIYIGKAVSLKKRLASYFRPPEQLDPKTQALVGRLAEIELVLTDSEVEALILECTLIKKHHPHYNILMRDDKSYPYLKLTVQEPYPRLLMTRRPFADEARYFGPFLYGSIKEIARIISFHFGLRICKLDLVPGQVLKRPCLYAQMGQCDAVCRGESGSKAYAKRVKTVLAFLDGKADSLTPELKKKMRQAAEAQQYELAARLRDQLRLVAEIRQQPVLSSTGREDRDVLGLARSGKSATVEIFTVRGGNLEGRRHYYLQHVGADTDEEVLSQVLTQYYSRAVAIPPEILMPLRPADEAVIRLWLENRRAGEIRLEVPQSGPEHRLLKMAETNAWLFLKHSEAGSAQELTDQDREALSELGAKLGLPGPPLRVEGYDISNISGQDAVGSQVVFVNGRPEKTQYRRYRIRSVTGPNDYAMLQEVLYRRLKHLKDEGGVAPDLIMVDGGAGQLSAARAVLQELELLHLPVVGLAKQYEEIYLPEKGEPLRLPKDSQALFFMTRLRDEAHRFAVSYHRQLRSRRMSMSALDRVEGLGPVTRRILLRKFGSVEAIMQVPESELAAVNGIGPSLAGKIRAQLGRGKTVNRPYREPPAEEKK